MAAIELYHNIHYLANGPSIEARMQQSRGQMR
jgi:hypothetical protein